MSSQVVVVERVSGEVYLFRDSADAETYLEPIDVEDGVYDAFDGSGAVLSLEVIAASGSQEVKVSRDSTAAPVPDVLRLRLKRYFMGMSEWRSEYDSLELSDLVAKLCERFARM